MKCIPISIISAAFILGTPLALQANTSRAESLHQAFEEIDQQPCDDRKTVIKAGTKYSVCTANAGGQGQYRFISASATVIETGDGIGYWYYLNGKVAAIRFFHNGQLFMFDGGGELQAELIPAQKVMLNEYEQFQNRSVRTIFSKAERDRLEKLAQEGGKEILSKFRSVRSKSEQPLALRNYCLKVIKDTTQRLEAIPNVKVTDNSQFTKLLIPYPERSAQLDRRYVFAVSGSGVETVWKSPELMTEITRQIIDGCYGVAAVTFGRDRTGDSATVGKFPDGSIKKFTCGADFDRHTRTRPPLSWGQQVCDI